MTKPRGPYKPLNANTTWTETQFRRAVLQSGTIAEVARRLGISSRTTVVKYIAYFGLDISHFRGYGHVTDSVRFWRKVTKPPDGCWIWTDTLNHDGYGRFKVDARHVMAHVFAFVDTIGAVPDGLELDHTCNNRACVRPSHLEPVTHAENVRRAMERRR